MSILEAIFLFLCVYIPIEAVMMTIAALQGENVIGRVVTWCVALLGAFALWFILTSSQGQVLT